MDVFLQFIFYVHLFYGLFCAILCQAPMVTMASSSTVGGQKFPDGRHVLRLGDSLFSKTAPLYHTMRYDFKPASVGDCKETYVEVAENQEVTVTVPKLDDAGEVRDATMFKGPRKHNQKECLLIYNHDTGEFVLEQLSYNVQLKKTRGEVTEEVLQNIRDTRKKLMHSAGAVDSNVSASTTPVQLATVGQATSRNEGNNNDGDDAQMMSDSDDGSRSDSDSSDAGGGSDEEMHSDNEQNADNGSASEDELAKALEGELYGQTPVDEIQIPSSQESSNTSGRSQNNFNSATRQNAIQPAASRLHEDLLLSEDSDDD